MKHDRHTTYFLRVTMEDREWQKVKLWASFKAAMEVPLVTDAILWKRLRHDLYDLGIFSPSILDDAERELFSAGHVRLPLATLRESDFKTIGLHD